MSRDYDQMQPQMSMLLRCCFFFPQHDCGAHPSGAIKFGQAKDRSSEKCPCQQSCEPFIFLKIWWLNNSFPVDSQPARGFFSN